MQLPSKYNDHVMNNNSQNRSISKYSKRNDEIRVYIGETEEESSVSQGNKLGNEANKLGDLNARYEDTSENETDKSADFDFVSQNYGKEQKVSNKECLDECIEEIELNVNKQNDSASVLDHSLNNKNDNSEGMDSNKECLDDCVTETEQNVNKHTDSPSVLDHSLNEKNDNKEKWV
uniref:Uncharacterized protein n=1 Tax=Tanacetum cinerariifolium TaxID=118510 RepID=A0A6L2LV90_TANCI|nr:hypothetical protein [Tanacetum cinerariifolium]